MTKYLYDCQFCGFPTDHPSRTCIAHRDLQPPLAGLDEPYFLDAPYDDALESEADALPLRDPGVAGSERAPAAPADPGRADR